jgi:hypothetical protein
MKVREELHKEHSKLQVRKIARWVSNDPLRFAELMECFFSDDLVLSQRAAWAMNECAENHPELILPWLEQMIRNLDNPVHDAVRRNTVRVMSYIDIPSDLLGLATSHCFNLLISPTEPIAVKAFSMSALLNITKKENGLKNELQIVVLDLMENGSPAIISRGKKVLAELEKIP